MDVSALVEIQRRSYARASHHMRGAWPEADALSEAEMGAFLDRHRYCVLATARPDGRAHAAPVGFIVHDNAFWFATVEGLRLRNVSAQRWAALTVMEGDADVGEEGRAHVALTAEGDVTVHEPDRWKTFEREWLHRHTDPPDWAAAILELRPVRLFSHAAAR